MTTVVLVGVAACSAAAATDQAAVSAVVGRKVTDIVFEGSVPVPAGRLAACTGIRPGDVVTHSLLKRAIQGLYDTGRVDGVAVDAQVSPSGVILRFVMRPAYLFNRFLVHGKVPFSGRSAWEVIAFPVGERYSRRSLDRVVDLLRTYLKSRGYYKAAVSATTARDEQKFLVDTTLAVDPGPRAVTSEVTIAGVDSSQLAVVQERLGLRAGQPYDSAQVKKRVDALKSYLTSRGFLAASVETAETYSEPANSVALRVVVANPGRVRVAVEGFGVPRDRLRRLLPVFTGGGVQEAVVEEGTRNLLEYLEDQGYPLAEISVKDETVDRIGRRLTYSVDPGIRVTVAYIRFRGNRALAEEELSSVLQMRASGFLRSSAYSAERFESDTESLIKLYHDRGYLDAKVIGLVEPLDGARKLGIVFEIAEGTLARAGAVTLSGNATLPGESLMPRMRIRRGSPFSPQLAEADRQVLLAAYNDAGFLNAAVTWQAGEPDSTGTRPVTFSIEERTRTHVGDVIVLGDVRTRPGVIEKRIGFRTGDPLSLGQTLQAQQALYDLGIFDLVRVTPQSRDSSAPSQNVLVRVEESDEVTVRYGFGYQEREKLRGTLEVGRANIFGFGQRGSLRLRMSGIEQGAALSIEQPQVRFVPVNSYLSLSWRQKQEVSFDSRRLNLSYQFSRPLSQHSWALLRYNARNVRVSDLQVQESELERTDAPRNLSTVSAIYVNDSRDNYLDPESGFFTSTDLSITSRLPGFSNPSASAGDSRTGGIVPTSNYLSLFSQSSYFRPLPSRLLLGLSLRVGMIRPFGAPVVPISERFFAGGGSSLRGFDTDRAGPFDANSGQPLGGNGLLIGNVELRAPVFRALQAVGFYDAGNVYRRVGDISLSGLSHTVGIGIRLRTPFGPLRADYGFNVNLPSELRAIGYQRRQLFLTIGPPF